MRIKRPVIVQTGLIVAASAALVLTGGIAQAMGHHSAPKSAPVGCASAPVGHHSAPVGKHSTPVGKHSGPVGKHSGPVGCASAPKPHPTTTQKPKPHKPTTTTTVKDKGGHR